MADDFLDIRDLNAVVTDQAVMDMEKMLSNHRGIMLEEKVIVAMDGASQGVFNWDQRRVNRP
jgi:hypothetical protein